MLPASMITLLIMGTIYWLERRDHVIKIIPDLDVLLRNTAP